MLVETVWERKSSMALKTKIEAVVMAKISNANHAYLQYALEVWTYFHPCNEVSWKKAVPKDFSFSKWNKSSILDNFILKNSYFLWVEGPRVG